MININIPGFNNTELELKHLVMDFNGTLAVDGKLIPGVKEKILHLSQKLDLHIVTGNTYQSVTHELSDLPCKIFILRPENQQQQKKDYILNLGKDSVISIGNGRNDKEMLQISAIGVVVIQNEGAAVETLMVSDLVCTTIFDAFDLLEDPRQLISSLRS